MSYLIKKTVQRFDSFYKLNEKEVPVTIASPSIKISETQPNISHNEILEPSEEESRDFDKTPSNAIIGIKTPPLQKSLSYENSRTLEDVRNIRAQFSILKSHLMCEFLSLNQKNYLPSENLEKVVNDMKV